METEGMPLGMVGVVVYPFIFVCKKHVNNRIVMNHERIHLAQYEELGILGFWPVYLTLYIRELMRYEKHFKAYINNPMEQEAFDNQLDLQYLRARKPYSWAKYL